MSGPGSAEEHERAKRRRCPACSSAPSSARESRMRWIVGTAENQVAPCVAQSAQKALAEKRRGAITQPPEASVASVEATSPCTWKSGIAQWLASSPVSA